MRTPNNTDGPRNLLGTILVVNNLVNISIVLIATVVAEDFVSKSNIARLAQHADPRGRRDVLACVVWRSHSQDLCHDVWG